MGLGWVRRGNGREGPAAVPFYIGNTRPNCYTIRCPKCSHVASSQLLLTTPPTISSSEAWRSAVRWRRGICGSIVAIAHAPPGPSVAHAQRASRPVLRRNDQSAATNTFSESAHICVRLSRGIFPARARVRTGAFAALQNPSLFFARLTYFCHG
jgi:hypothetical protein